MFEQILQELTETYRFRYVVYSHVITNLKLRYRRSALGFMWTVLAPMLNYLVIGLVFTVLMRNRRPDYFLYYFSGAVFFGIISGVLSRSTGIFLENEHFIKKIYLPKLVFVLSRVGIELVNFFLSASALITLGYITGMLHLSWHVVLTIIPVFLIALFLLGLSCILAVATVYFRDFLHIIPVIVQALFFVTPIIYDKSMVPEKFHWGFNFNPFYYFIEIFRQPLVDHTIPSLKMYIVPLVSSLVMLPLGLYIVKKFDNKIVFKL